MTEHPGEKAQRVRIRFARGPEAGEVGHLDLTRYWERALVEGRVPVSYSQGNRPQPRITIAAGLPTGVTSEGELLDVVLAQALPPGEVLQLVASHLPPGLQALEAWEVGMSLPSLPAAIRWAEYEVEIAASNGGAVAAAVDAFLARESFPWEDTRGEKVRRYDLRPLVAELRANGHGDTVRLSMRLRCDNAGVGRAEQVVKALGLGEPTRVHRRRLLVAERSPAHDVWRRTGRFRE